MAEGGHHLRNRLPTPAHKQMRWTWSGWDKKNVPSVNIYIFMMNKASEDAHLRLKPNQREWKYKDGHQRG